MIRHTNRKTFITKMGRQITTDSSFINRLHTPRKGWSVDIVLNEVTRTITGNGPSQVFAEVKKYLLENDTVVSDDDIWFSLNYQWAERSEDHRLIVKRESIFDAEIKEDTPEKDYYPPSIWGSIAWKYLGLHLSIPEKEFKYESFLMAVEQVLLLLNPVKVPHLGCIECYTEFSRQVASLRTKSLERDTCRSWLFDFHNSVNLRLGKTILTFEQAAKENLWT